MQLLSEKKHFKTIEADKEEKRTFTVEGVASFLMLVYSAYYYTFHPKSVGPSFTSTMSKVNDFSENEHAFFESWRAARELKGRDGAGYF